MDSVLHQLELEACKSVPETTKYLEITVYSDGGVNCIQDQLLDDDFEDFIHRQGPFAPKETDGGLEITSVLRLVVQDNAVHPETFAPRCISIKRDHYKAMVKAFHLPLREIESSAFVGPCFIASEHGTAEDERYLQILFRKSDIRKQEKTRGWQIVLSHNLGTGVTSGFIKGTPTSIIASIINIITETECQGDAGHPMLLPILILSSELSSRVDARCRDARQWLRRLENAISMRNADETSVDAYKAFDADVLGHDLIECNSQALWKPPRAYLDIIESMEGVMARLRFDLPPSRLHRLLLLQKSITSRLDFLKAKLKSMDVYTQATLDRLNLQREMMQRITAERDSKLNSEMARLAYASKRDSSAMKTLSLLSALFLPGTFVASILSMTFFDFHVGDNDESTAGKREVSEKIWIYFAVTVPLTLSIVAAWWFFNNRRQQRATNALDGQQDISRLENEIMKKMRLRTISSMSHWRSFV